MTKGTKIGLIIGGLVLVVGGGVGIYLYVRKNKKLKDVEFTAQDEASMDKSPIVESYVAPPTTVSEVNVDVAPPVESISSKEKSYNNILNRFKDSSNTKRYADYFTYTASPTVLGLQGQPKDYTARVKFQKDGGWRLHLMRGNEEVSFLTGGLYYKAGTKLVVYNGKNKGLIVESSNPLNNVVRVMTA